MVMVVMMMVVVMMVVGRLLAIAVAGGIVGLVLR